MATKYIITQLWSPRHIVTRGFGPFIEIDYGQSEIVELGMTNVTRNLNSDAYVARSKGLIAKVFTESATLTER